MASIPQTDETDIPKLVEMARSETTDPKVIPWIIERSPSWRNKGYSELKAAIEAEGIELA